MRTDHRVAYLSMAVVVLLAAGVALAGTMYSLHCKDKACGYKDEIGFGGTFQRAEMTGFCTKCGTLVTFSWKRSEKAPAPVCTIWDAKTGKTLNLYKCPTCANPFLPIGGEEEFKCCPKCSKPTLVLERTIMYD